MISNFLSYIVSGYIFDITLKILLCILVFILVVYILWRVSGLWTHFAVLFLIIYFYYDIFVCVLLLDDFDLIEIGYEDGFTTTSVECGSETRLSFYEEMNVSYYDDYLDLYQLLEVDVYYGGGVIYLKGLILMFTFSYVAIVSLLFFFWFFRFFYSYEKSFWFFSLCFILVALIIFSVLSSIIFFYTVCLDRSIAHFSLSLALEIFSDNIVFSAFEHYLPSLAFLEYFVDYLFSWTRFVVFFPFNTLICIFLFITSCVRLRTCHSKTDYKVFMRILKLFIVALAISFLTFHFVLLFIYTLLLFMFFFHVVTIFCRLYCLYKKKLNSANK